MGGGAYGTDRLLVPHDLRTANLYQRDEPDAQTYDVEMREIGRRAGKSIRGDNTDFRGLINIMTLKTAKDNQALHVRKHCNTFLGKRYNETARDNQTCT